MQVEGRRVLVVGAARSGIASAEFLLDRGARVTITDSRPPGQLEEAQRLVRERGALLEAGEHTEATFTSHDLVVVSPGVPAGLPQLDAARRAGIEVIGEVELAYRFLQGRIVGITGSNGKTTTTALTGNVLAAAGFTVQVGGNIGKPYPALIDMVDTSTPDTVNVVELSSFQLETIRHFRAAIAIVLNVTPDHLDRHAGFEAYVAAKRRIFENQTAEDFAVLNADDAVCRGYAGATKGKVRWFSRRGRVDVGAYQDDEDLVFAAEGWPPQTMFGIEEIPLPGAHNVENVLAACCAATILGADIQKIREGVRSFPGVEHRLEWVASINGVDYYNDSKATNVDATIKALEAFPGNLLVILGGKDKGSDYTVLRPLLAERARCALLIGAAAEKIAEQVGDATELVPAATLDRALTEAARRAQPGDVVLLAPACASFDQFENYEHRGRVFKELVQTLEKGTLQ